MKPNEYKKPNLSSMNRDSGNKSTAQRKSTNTLLVGILAGMIIGVGMAAAVAWFMKRTPSPFVNREQPALAMPQPEPALPAIPVEQSPAQTGGDKQRFQFYKILTDKQNTPPAVPAAPAVQSRQVKLQSPAFQPQILQAGSFPNAIDAENLKAKLALLGVEASIQSATIKDKGVWYRVRLGPYKTAEDMNKARGFLKQNGVDSTPMRVQ
ncbi:MAG: SPOR domain-containing protein [Gallionella sp.]|nr:SPOR domain-containing protein [Gallionella sp.]